MEEQLGRPLPASFRAVLVRGSRRVHIFYELPRDGSPHRELGDLQLGWGLAEVPAAEEDRRGWVDAPVANTYREPVWQRCLAFKRNAAGDHLAFDPLHGDGRVVYLDHVVEDIHGYVLGHDLQDYVTRASQLGCVGDEHWTYTPFLTDATSGLSTTTPFARQWRTWLFGQQ